MAAIPIIDAPLLDRVHRLASPAFAVSPPIRHAQTAREAKAPHILESLWNRRFVSTDAIDFYRLRNVFVTLTGLVFDEQGRVYRPSIGYSARDDITAAMWAINRIRHSGPQTAESHPAILCTQPARNPYFHWLAVGLPRAMLACAELALNAPRYVLAHAPDPLRAVMRESLGLAGIGAAEIIETGGAPRFFAELFLIDGLTEPELYLSPLVARCLDKIREAVPPARVTRIFVVPAATASHRLAQADDLTRIAEQEGYVAVDPTTMRLIEQISLFKGASHAVAFGGAPLANALFMAEGSHIGALMPAGAIDNGGWLISQLKRHHYAELVDKNPPPPEGYRAPDSQRQRVVVIGKTAFRRFLRGL